MKTKEVTAELSGITYPRLVCEWCGGENFKVSFAIDESGKIWNIAANCKCGYGINWNVKVTGGLEAVQEKV